MPKANETHGIDFRRLRAVCFDLDGTLVDHFEAIHASINLAEAKLGLSKSSYEKIRSVVGGSIPVTLGRLHPDGVPIDRLMREVERAYPQVRFQGLRVLPGVPEILQHLKALGIPCAVFTNKLGDDARELLEELDLAEAFEVIVGMRDTPWVKPDPRFTAWILGRLQCQPEEALMIGDSPFDFQAADSVGLRAVLVGTGTHSVEELAKTGAEAVFPSMVQVREALLPRAVA